MLKVAVLTFVLSLLAVVAAAYGVALYNALLSARHRVEQAWAGIDKLFRQRQVELTRLIDAVERHAAGAPEWLQKMTALQARTGRGEPDDARLAAEDALSRDIAGLLAEVEASPGLLSSEDFAEPRQRLGWLEEQITPRRAYYNDAAQLNNLRLRQLPTRCFAAAAGLVRRPLFAPEVAADAAPEAAGGAVDDVKAGALVAP